MFASFLLLASLLIQTLADECSDICTSIPLACSHKGSYCKNGHSCMDLFWLVEGEIFCNHTNLGCVGKREVTCTEARAIVSSRNAGRARGSGSTSDPPSPPPAVASRNPGRSHNAPVVDFRSRDSLDMTGSLLGCIVDILMSNRQFVSAVASGVSSRSERHDMDVLNGLQRRLQSNSWEDGREFVTAIERHPQIEMPGIHSVNRLMYRNSPFSTQTVFKSLIAASESIASLFTLVSSSGEHYSYLEAKNEEGESLETSLVVNYSTSLSSMAFSTLPNLLLVMMTFRNDRCRPLDDIPFEIDFARIAQRVHSSAGSTRYRLVALVSGYHEHYEVEHIDPRTGQWIIKGIPQPSGVVPNTQSNRLSALLYERI
jgi:hypothetical protein